MQFFTEAQIENTNSLFENQEIYDDNFKQMLSENDCLISFLEQENFKLLTPDETALLEYLLTVIYKTVKDNVHKTPKISLEILEQLEDENWSVFNDKTGNNLEKTFDIFFDGYDQEDLLALIEDSIIETEEEEISLTQVGKEIIAITCKSFIDMLHYCIK